jgi:DNA-binding ferritin-like protein
MKKLIFVSLLTLLTSCKKLEKKNVHKTEPKAKNEILYIQPNNNVLKNEISYSENLTNEVDDFVNNLGDFATPEEFTKIHKSIEDSIYIYRSKLILDLTKVKKTSEEFNDAKDMIEMLKLDSIQFQKDVDNQINMIHNSFGSASYSTTDSRYQNTNRYYIYLMWKHYLFLQAIGEDSRGNLIIDE